MEKAGFATVLESVTKTTKGEIKVCKVTSGQKGLIVTSVCCVSATGF
jgi:hypothetical protein